MQCDDHGINHDIGISVAETDIGKLYGGGTVVGQKRVVVVLKHDRTGCEGSRVRRRDGLIEQCSGAQHLDFQLQRIAGAHTKNSGVEINGVDLPWSCEKGLGKGVALTVPSLTKGGCITSAGGGLSVI